MAEKVSALKQADPDTAMSILLRMLEDS